jgi:phosphate transport system protein
LSVDLHKELLNLRRHILSMGARVESLVNETIDALFKQNMEEARRVRTSDDEIDAMELDIEQETLRLLALTQPVATDLRFILAVVRINTDLERIAYLAKSIAKRVLAMSDDVETIDLPPALRDMADRSRQMLGDSLAALANNDAALCNNIRKAGLAGDRRGGHQSASCTEMHRGGMPNKGEKLLKLELSAAHRIE